ncbi:MAG: hypothetical protein ACREL9_04350 [Gemmatimonadales bacterium]
MRHRFVHLGLAAGLVAGAASAARAQLVTTDARRVGVGGLSLHRGGPLSRYNPAYRVVPARPAEGPPKLTMPIPIGLFQFLKDHPPRDWDTDPLFNRDSSAFNPIEALNVVLHPPVFYEIKEVPTPTNDVEFTIGKNELIADLGNTRTVIPSDEFGLGGSSRLLDLGAGVLGFRFGVMGWMHNDVGFRLGDRLRAFLKDAEPADTNTRYNMLVDGLVQAGFAPTVSYAGRLFGDSTRGLYLGGALRYYFGAGYIKADGDAGFTTGDTLFSSSNPLTEDIAARIRKSELGNSLGTGFGGDIGLVWISGPIEIGLGVNDIGALLTWSDTKIDSLRWDATGDSIVTTTIANGVESKTKLPVAYVANVAFGVGEGTTVGADIVDNGRGTAIHVGGEKRLGALALRAGVARDQRKRMQFGWGGGVRFGPVSLDVGFFTHSNSFSDARGITMATSFSIY